MKTNKHIRNAADQMMIDGITKHLGKGGSITFDGKKYSAAEIVKLLLGRIAVTTSVASAKALAAKAVAAEHAQLEETTPIVSGIRQVLALLYKSQPDVLADLGIATRKPRRDMTVEEKALAVEKVLATRKARGTMGNRQRAKIHGATGEPAAPTPTPVTVSAPVPVTAPVPPPNGPNA